MMAGKDGHSQPGCPARIGFAWVCYVLFPNAHSPTAMYTVAPF